MAAGAWAQQPPPQPDERSVYSLDPEPLVLLDTEPIPPWNTGGPESIPPSRNSDMEMLFEKTIFQVNVARVRVRVDRKSALRLKDLMEGHGSPEFTDGIADQVAEIVLQAPDAWVHMEFMRGASLGQFMSGIRRNMERAVKAGFVTQPHFERVSRQLPIWYAFLEERGVRDGDVGFYRIHADSLRTVFADGDGEVFLDQVDFDPPARYMVLGSYFARGSDFREKLVKSLLEQWHRRERTQSTPKGSR